MGLVYLPTFTIKKINQMQINIPYIDGMGKESTTYQLATSCCILSVWGFRRRQYIVCFWGGVSKHRQKGPQTHTHTDQLFVMTVLAYKWAMGSLVVWIGDWVERITSWLSYHSKPPINHCLYKFMSISKHIEIMNIYEQTPQQITNFKSNLGIRCSSKCKPSKRITSAIISPKPQSNIICHQFSKSNKSK